MVENTDANSLSRTPGRRPSLVSVIMPAFNSAGTIEHQLLALNEQTYSGSWELIIADNGSKDETVATARQWEERFAGQLRIVRANDAQGSYHARNVGARNARGDLLVFCDSDDIADPGWLEMLVEAAEGCELVGGALDAIDSGRRPKIESALQPRLWTILDFLPFSGAGNLAVWAEVFESLEGFNEFLKNGGDADFCWRAQLSGYTLGFASSATIRYRYRSNLSGLARQFYRYGRVHPYLFRTFRSHGVKRRSAKVILRDWLDAVRGVLRMPWSNRESRGAAVIHIATLAGRIRGCIEHRTLYL